MEKVADKIAGEVISTTGNVISFAEHIRNVEAYLDHLDPSTTAMERIFTQIGRKGFKSLKETDKIFYSLNLLLDDIYMSPLGGLFLDEPEDIHNTVEKGLIVLELQDVAARYRHWLTEAIAKNLSDFDIEVIGERLLHECQLWLEPALESYAASNGVFSAE